MSKTLQVAVREFVSTVSTKGFIVGTLIFPAIMIVAITFIPKLLKDVPPEYVGKVAVLDKSGWQNAEGLSLIDQLQAMNTPEAIKQRREEEKQRRKQMMNQAATQAVGEDAAKLVEGPVDEAVDQTEGDSSEGVPILEFIALDPDVDLEAKKAEMREGTAFDGSLLTLFVIDEHAVVKGAEGYGAYETYVRPGLDDRYQDPLRSDVTNLIRGARLVAAEYDAELLAEIQNVNAAKAQEITEEGERERTGSEFNFLIAAAFMMLLWISVMSGGQYLMTTVITEKSNRVMEVLLSAVSPKQLMTGKILGQMCVALSILGIYVTIGLVALDQFGFLHLIQKSDIALMIVYFFLAFFFLATAMAAIGSAVTEIMEANALITPVIMVLIIPWLLMAPLSQNPNSTFATIMGLIPPISPFAMVIREAGTDPIPVWQHVAAIGIGIVAVYAAIWATAKIFRIGVLMYGKPPNLRTLVKWVRMA